MSSAICNYDISEISEVEMSTCIIFNTWLGLAEVDDYNLLVIFYILPSWLSQHLLVLHVTDFFILFFFVFLQSPYISQISNIISITSI